MDLNTIKQIRVNWKIIRSPISVVVLRKNPDRAREMLCRDKKPYIFRSVRCSKMFGPTVCRRTTDEGCTNVSVHGGGKAHSFFLAAVNGFLQRVDHLLVRVDLIIEQHAIVRVSFVPKHTKKPYDEGDQKAVESAGVCIFVRWFQAWR